MYENEVLVHFLILCGGRKNGKFMLTFNFEKVAFVLRLQVDSTAAFGMINTTKTRDHCLAFNVDIHVTFCKIKIKAHALAVLV